MTDEILEIVDTNNNIIGTQKRSIVYKESFIHRASHIFIQNNKKEIYIQKRSSKRKTWPNKWDLSAAETLKPRESYEQCALRGLEEELGIKNIEVTMICEPYLETYYDEFSQLKASAFFGLFLSQYNQAIVPDNVEVTDGKFISLKEVEKLLISPKSNVTPWFRVDFLRLKKYLENR